jgi:hypothetical protein
MNKEMRAEKETESEGATPEQLMQMLDLQLNSHRSQRAGASRNRAIILVVGLLFIVAAAGAALLVLDQMLADLRQNGSAAHPAENGKNTNF